MKIKGMISKRLILHKKEHDTTETFRTNRYTRYEKIIKTINRYNRGINNDKQRSNQSN